MTTGGLKEVLADSYIGAIATGYIIGRGFESLFSAFMPAINVILAEAFTSRRLAEDPWASARFSFISNILLTGMYFAVAYLLGSWLYPTNPKAD